MEGKFFPDEATAVYAARAWNQRNADGDRFARAEQCGSGWVVGLYEMMVAEYLDPNAPHASA